MTTPTLPRRLRSFLLRVTVESGEQRFLVQDLRTGQRHEFTSERALKRFLAEHKPVRLR